MNDLWQGDRIRELELKHRSLDEAVTRLGRHDAANGGGERFWDVSFSRAGVR